MFGKIWGLWLLTSLATPIHWVYVGVAKEVNNKRVPHLSTILPEWQSFFNHWTFWNKWFSFDFVLLFYIGSWSEKNDTFDTDSTGSLVWHSVLRHVTLQKHAVHVFQYKMRWIISYSLSDEHFTWPWNEICFKFIYLLCMGFRKWLWDFNKLHMICRI